MKWSTKRLDKEYKKKRRRVKKRMKEEGGGRRLKRLRERHCFRAYIDQRSQL